MDDNVPTTPVADGEDTPANRTCQKINTKLLPHKCFYLLFFSAVGSLFPYLVIFYKQLFLSAQQTGILIGIRPMLQLISSSVWGMIADKSEKSKWIFLVSLLAWLSSNFSLSLVKHPMDLGPCLDNGTLTMTGNILHISPGSSNFSNRESNVSLQFGDSRRIYKKQTISFIAQKNRSLLIKGKNKTDFSENNLSMNNSMLKIKVALPEQTKERKVDELNALGHSPWSLAVTLNFEEEAVETNTKHHQDNGSFFFLLAITVVGTLIAAPAIPLADTATLHCLGDKKEFYGKQRQWGSLGWGLSSFVVGSVVSTLQEKANCNVPTHVDYTPCFYAFAILMMTSFIPAVFFNFENMYASAADVSGRLRTLLDFHCVSFLATVFVFGCSWGLIQTFLLWHLQDQGGTQFLFSIISAVQCLSEILSYHWAGHVIKLFGHYRVLYVGLLFSSLRFVLYGLIKNPWLVLPIEIFHGSSTTLIWSLAVSFIGLKPGVATTMQGLLSGVHWGLGLGGGAILGGLLINCFGASHTFIAFGVISFISLLFLVVIRNLKCLQNSSEESRSLLGRPGSDDEQGLALKSMPTSTMENFP